MEQLIAISLSLLVAPLLVPYMAFRSLWERTPGEYVWNASSGRWEWRWPSGYIAMGLWAVAIGEMKWLGPRRGSPAAALHPAGLFSPEQLQQQMGLDVVADDASFFASATTLQKGSVLLRSLLAQIYGGHPELATANEVRIFGVQFRNTTMARAVAYIADAAQEAGSMRRVFFVNADCLNLAYADRDYHFLLHDADFVLPDGSGVRLGLKWLGTAMQDNLNGTDLFPHLCAEAQRRGQRLYLLGGLPGIAQRTAQNMQELYPGLVIAGARDGYFDDSQTDAVIADINSSGADILLLGMGAPRQERWLSDHASDLSVGVGVGVGGLFDYYSGEIARAPLWLRELGLEWVWRILQQPGEKWRRYVVGNPLFLSRVLRQRFSLGRKSWAALETQPEKLGWISQCTQSRFAEIIGRLSVLTWRARLDLATASKRCLDVAVAAVAVVLLSPVLVAFALVIKFSSSGPVTYKQTRIGRRGQPFVMYKFRSMLVDSDARLADLERANESEGGVLFKIARDPRITPIGRWMRRFSIDELPQLFNVLNGTMSLVGPRPALPTEVDEYQSQHLKRLQSKPGLTCWWQVSGRSDLSFSEQIDLDMRYMRDQSIGEDLRLLARTVPAVISGKGAY